MGFLWFYNFMDFFPYSLSGESRRLRIPTTFVEIGVCIAESGVHENGVFLSSLTSFSIGMILNKFVLSGIIFDISFGFFLNRIFSIYILAHLDECCA